MKQTFFIIALTTLILSCTNSQTNSPLTGNIRKDIESLLHDGEHLADLMDGIRQNQRQADLTAKMQEGISKNYKWFMEYLKSVPEGEPMPYHSKLGMTKAEYDELMVFMDNIEIVSTGKEIIKTYLTNDTLYFRSAGKLSDFDSLKIDLKNNVVIFGQYKMNFVDTITVNDEKNGLRSKWKGYTWKYEEPDDFDLTDLEDLDNLRMKQYKFTLGRLEKNGKIYMSLKGREIEDGAKTVEFELPVVF